MSTTLVSLPSFGALTVYNTLGAVFVGEVLTAVLYGVSILQFYSYHRKNPSDHVLMKGLLFVIFLLDTIHFIEYTQAAWFYGITNYLNSLVNSNPVHWSLQFAYISGICTEVLIDGIYSYKIYKLGGPHTWNTVVAVQIFVTCIIAGAFGTVLTARVTKYSLLELHAKTGWLLYVELSLQIAVNVEIAASVFVLLWKMRTGVRRTDSLIRTLVSFTLNTMALSCVVAIAGIVTVAASPNTLVYVPILAIHPKIMVNSLLAFLDSRESFKADVASGLVSIHLSRLRFPQGESSDATVPPSMAAASDVEKQHD